MVVSGSSGRRRVTGSCVGRGVGELRRPTRSVRRGLRGTPDDARVPYNARRPFDRLARNRRGERRWAVADSYGRRIATVEQRGRTVRVVRADGASYEAPVGEVRLELQGRGAHRDPSRTALVAIRVPNADYRVRGFVDGRALPRFGARRRPLRDVVDRYDAAGRRAASRVREARRSRVIRLANPGFSYGDYFVGSDGRRRTLATYNARPEFGGATYLLANTPGVRGGGIVRGVVREGQRFRVLDSIRRGGNASTAVTWLYGRTRGGFYGWVPWRGGR
jgi:hypothetical protein